MKEIAFDPLKTILTITVGFLLIHIFTDLQWALFVAIFIGLAGLVSPYLAKQINFLWEKLTWVLSLIVPNILLSIIFYLFLTPIAWASKLFQKEDVLKLKNPTGSVFRDSNKFFDKKSFENPW